MSKLQPVQKIPNKTPSKSKVFSPAPLKPGKSGCQKFGHNDTTHPIKTSSDQPSQIKSTSNNKLADKNSVKQLGNRAKRTTKNFEDLRQECLRKKTLFKDDEFPPTNCSINFTDETDIKYEWKRPSELVADPRFLVEGATRFDIQQGNLGDCWLLAAILNLTMHPRLFHHVVSLDQGFQSNYAGIFHFRFWQYGKWEDIIIDDFLPTHEGHLTFMHSKTENEFWCALLEKAYAKMHGGYEALRGGNVSESMVDLTGGVVENVNIRESQKELFTKLKRAFKRGAMMGCSFQGESSSMCSEERLPNGLIAGHAYSITKVKRVPYLGSHVELLRLHNPWGNEAEWKGAWSDGSSEWNSVCEEERKELGLTFNDDGEFWMPFKDFTDNFTVIDICDVTPEVFSSEEGDEDLDDKCIAEAKRQWEMKMYEDEWVPGVSAGGCINFSDTFPTNPQKVVVLDIPEENSDECVLVVSLMQKYMRQNKQFGGKLLPIGFSIYKLPPDADPGKPLDSDFLESNENCGSSGKFLNARSVCRHFRLPPGTYVVIPCTFKPNCAAQFLLRIFSESHRK